MTNEDLIADIENEISEIKSRISALRTGALPTVSGPEWDLAVAEYGRTLAALSAARSDLR